MSKPLPHDNLILSGFTKLQKEIVALSQSKKEVSLEKNPLFDDLKLGINSIKHLQKLPKVSNQAALNNQFVLLNIITTLMIHNIERVFLEEYFYQYHTNPKHPIITSHIMPSDYKDSWTEKQYLQNQKITHILFKALNDCKENILRVNAEFFATCKRLQQNIENGRNTHIKLVHKVRSLIKEKQETLERINELNEEINKLEENPSKKTTKEIAVKNEHIKKLEVIVQNIDKDAYTNLDILDDIETQEIESLKQLHEQKINLDIIDGVLDENIETFKKQGLEIKENTPSYSFDTTSILNLFQESKQVVASNLKEAIINPYKNTPIIE